MAELIEKQFEMSGGSMEHVLHGVVDAPMRWGTFVHVWLIEKHCKAQDFGG